MPTVVPIGQALMQGDLTLTKSPNHLGSSFHSYFDHILRKAEEYKTMALQGGSRRFSSSRVRCVPPQRSCRSLNDLLEGLTAPATTYSVTVGGAARPPLTQPAAAARRTRRGQEPAARGYDRLAGPDRPALPGLVVSTATKPDVVELNSSIRARTGPVLVFSPKGVGGVPSRFGWNRLDGCQDPQVAIRRADAFS